MFHFFAYIARMKLIDRWSLMRCTQRENVQEHSLQVATTAHALALIQQKYFGGQTSPEKVALYAIYHDVSEVVTGDLPTPVKYFNDEIRSAYKAIESHATDQLLKLLPLDLRPDYDQILNIPQADREASDLIKAADTICAYIKCLEEKSAGNHEFSRAEKTIRVKIDQLITGRPEVAYFFQHFMPSFSATIDELNEPLI